MSGNRWIKLYSGIMESAVWADPLRLKAWIHILLSANYKDKEWFKNGQIVRIQRGQMVTSMRKLAMEWRCSRATTRRILDQFQDLNMIRYEVEPGKYTRITVVKYRVFQDSDGIGCATDVATDITTNVTTDVATDVATDVTQHKNIKNNKKDKNKDTPPSPWAGGADEYGPAPDGWDDEWEKDFMEDAWQNPGCTRAEWYEAWKDWTGKG